MVKLSGQITKPDAVLPDRLAHRRRRARAVEPQRCLPPGAHGADGERKYPARQRFGLFAEPAVDLAAIVLVEEDARAVGPLVQRPPAPHANIRRYPEHVGPALAVDPLALPGKQMPDQRPAAVTARMARPPLVGNRGHDHR